MYNYDCTCTLIVYTHRYSSVIPAIIYMPLIIQYPPSSLPPSSLLPPSPLPPLPDSQPSQLTVTPSTKWSEVQDYLTTPTDKPVVLNRSSSTNSVNPFGSTYCYGFQNFIFEVWYHLQNSHTVNMCLKFQY